MRYKIWLLLTAICLAGCSAGGFKLQVRFDDTGQLKKGDVVYFQNEAVGSVTAVNKTDQNKRIAALKIDKKMAGKVTDQTLFFIDPDPRENLRSAVVMVTGKTEGTPLKNGAIVDGAGRVFVFFHRLQNQVQEGLQEVLSQFDRFSQRLKKIPESKEFRQLETDLKSLAKKMAASGEAARESIQDELIPQLEKQLDVLKDRLKALGREKEIEPLETEMKKIRSI